MKSLSFDKWKGRETMGSQIVVRSGLDVSKSRGVTILDQDGNEIVNSEMTGGDEQADPDYWTDPKFERFCEEEEWEEI